MRLLHTSDWHLGRSFHQVGMLDAQARFLDHLVDVVRCERVDAVLVSGDVYDRALPSPDTVALLSEGLTRLVDTGARVIVSTGNHDSAVRLGFLADLLSFAGLHICSSLDTVGRAVLVEGVAVYPIPYLEPALVAQDLGCEQATHTAVLAAAMDRVRADRRRRGGPAVVMAHAFVAGGVGCESERDISVGGVAVVPASLFDGVDYVALGHLHGPQQVSDTVRYSGSPLALSFGEAGQVKGSVLVSVEPTGVRCEAIAAPVPRPLAVVRGTLADLLTDPRFADAEPAWCAAVLTDPARPVEALTRLRARFPHLLKIDVDPATALRAPGTYTARAARTRSDLDVCCDFLTHVRAGAGPDPAERALLAEALERSRLTDAAREREAPLPEPGRGVA